MYIHKTVSRGTQPVVALLAYLGIYVNVCIDVDIDVYLHMYIKLCAEEYHWWWHGFLTSVYTYMYTLTWISI